MKSRLRVLCFLFPLFCTLTLPGQNITASLQGHVADSTGALIEGATVTAVNVETGFSRTATTDAAGEFQITQLPVGNYKITAEAATFLPESHSQHLAVGDNAKLGFSLVTGPVREEISISTDAPLIEPTRTSVDSVIGEQQIQGLPVNGRQFIDFALLAPGVVIGDSTSGSTDVIIEPVTKLSFAGEHSLQLHRH